jgi:hypothetical protein
MNRIKNKWLVKKFMSSPGFSPFHKHDGTGHRLLVFDTQKGSPSSSVQ